jgi:hypothetical protein
MAERVGFEPTIPVKVCPLSRRIVSTTHAPLRRQLAAVSFQLSVKPLPDDKTLDPTTDEHPLTSVPEKLLQNFCRLSG